jgi:hypothetical protein
MLWIGNEGRIGEKKPEQMKEGQMQMKKCVTAKAH